MRKSGAFIGDAGYDAESIRSAAKARGMKVVIPSNPTRAVIHRYDRGLYRIRYRIECFFHRIKRCRRIATPLREDGPPHYLALLHLACALTWLG